MPHFLPTAPSLPRLRHTYAFLTLMVFAGCGGVDGSKVAAEAPKVPLSGSLQPAQGGVVLVEYGEDGQELQRSTPSDSTGAFLFPNPALGVRVEALDSGATTGRTTIRSARLLPDASSVLVTPLSTLEDQFTRFGVSGSVARIEVGSLVSGACTSVTNTFTPLGYEQLAGLPAPRGPLLQSAIAAYIDVLQDTGFRPGEGREWWPEKVRTHAGFLQQACTLASTVWSSNVEAEVRRVTATVAGQTADATMAVLESVRRQVFQDLTGLAGKAVALQEYPQLAHPGLLGAPWEGSPAALAVELITANMVSQLSARVAATDPGSFVATTVSRIGEREQYLAVGMSAAEAGRAVAVENQADGPRAVRLSFNGTRLGGPGSLIADMLSVPVERAADPLHLRIWRYVSLRHRNEYPITGGRMLHDPLVYLRSVGSGFCDDAASVLHLLWRDMGYESRVVGLNGHVVPEVKVNGRWEMYDPDLKVFFRLDDGRVAGVADIEADTSLLVRGIQRVSATEGLFDPSLLIPIYGSAEDNRPEAWYDEPRVRSLGADIWLPPGSRLTFDRNSPVLVQGFRVEQLVALKTIRLHLPAGFSGTVPLGLVLVDAIGNGSFSSPLGQNIRVDEKGILPAMMRWWELAPEAPITELVVHGVGEGGMTLLLAVNPKLVGTTPDLLFKVYGPNIDGLKLIGRQAGRS